MRARAQRRAGSSLAIAGLACAGIALLACGESPPPVAVAPARAPRTIAVPPDLERATRACVFLGGSSADDGPRDERDLATCVDRVLAVSALPRGGCLLAARSAFEVDACLGRASESADAARLCASRPGESAFCLGRAVVQCGERPSLVACTAGERCAETRLATGVVVRGCASECPADAPPVRCVNGDVVRCSPGMPAERTSCPLGTRCVEARGEGGELDAVCERAPCVPGRARCDGTRLESCVADESGHGSAVTTDCAAFGLTCATEGTRASCVTTEPYDCRRGASFCEGDALRACPGGVPVRVHCGAYGLGPCRIRQDGGAACGPSVPRAGNVR